MLNNITIMGRICNDIELRRTNSGKAVTSFAVAVDRDFEKGKADFLDVVCWGNTAEFAAKYFGKGRLAVINGRLQMRDWTDKDGNKHRNAEIIANSLYFGDSKKDAADNNNNFVEIEDDFDDVPF